jgi:hypothetical protein
MTVRVCAVCVSLDQKLAANTRAAFAPNSSDMLRVVASAARVQVRKQQITHKKVCGV